MQALFFSRKKIHLVESHHQGRPSRAPVNPGSTLGQRWVNVGSTLGQPWVNLGSTLGQPSVNLRSTFGQRWVNLRSTFGQPSVMSLAISARFSLILLDSQMKVRDRRHFFHEIVDFPIRKRHFRVRGWSGAFWEPLDRKKKRDNQMYLQNYVAKFSKFLKKKIAKNH